MRVAQENLKDLIDRNLVLVHQLGSCGKIKLCRIHDLLRDLCLKEAQKEKFLCVTEPHSYNIPEGIDKQRRIVIHESTRPQVLGALQSASLARSLICDQGVLAWSFPALLRVLKSGNDTAFKTGYSGAAIFDLVNLRYLASTPDLRLFRFPSSIQTFWNLQTLVVRNSIDVFAPSEFWKMSQLRHVMFNILHLPDPPNCRSDRENDVVLGNLQTLRKIVGFRCSEEVVKRIPNVKKLKIFYRKYNFKGEMYLPHFCLNNIGRLQKLHSLSCVFSLPTSPGRSGNLEGLTFPHSLKKLTLAGCQLHWEDMTTNVGSLPLLEVLKLRMRSCIGSEWKTTEGKFCSLKFLLMGGLDDLKHWKTNRDHFPCLERLVLHHLPKLEEIPLSIGDIPTLESIHLELCRDSAVISAKNILEEQEELENSGLQVRVRLSKKNEIYDSLKSLASSNFDVRV